MVSTLWVATCLANKTPWATTKSRVSASANLTITSLKASPVGEIFALTVFFLFSSPPQILSWVHCWERAADPSWSQYQIRCQFFLYILHISLLRFVGGGLSQLFQFATSFFDRFYALLFDLYVPSHVTELFLRGEAVFHELFSLIIEVWSGHLVGWLNNKRNLVFTLNRLSVHGASGRLINFLSVNFCPVLSQTFCIGFIFPSLSCLYSRYHW